MRSPIPWPWLLLALLLLLPGPAGRFLLDLLGGLTLTLLLLPLLAGGAVLVGWWVLRQRLRTCSTCGAVSLGSSMCPSCGSPLAEASGGSDWAQNGSAIDPRHATITVEAVNVPAEPVPSAGMGGTAPAGPSPSDPVPPAGGASPGTP